MWICYGLNEFNCSIYYCRSVGVVMNSLDNLLKRMRETVDHNSSSEVITTYISYTSDLDKMIRIIEAQRTEMNKIKNLLVRKHIERINDLADQIAGEE